MSTDGVQAPPHNTWLQRLRSVLEATPAITDVTVREEPDGWSVRVEYDYTDSNLYIAFCDVREMMQCVHDTYSSTKQRCRVRECTWFDSNEWQVNVGVAPWYWLEVEGIDPSVMSKAVESYNPVENCQQG